MDDGEEDVRPAEGRGSVRPPSLRPPSLRPSSPSQRPSRAPSPLVGVARVLFAVAWIGGQLALVLTADRRADGAFGFRTWSESSALTVALYREVDGGSGERIRVPVEGGVWTARDRAGMSRRFAWNDRVKRPELGVFDREIPAASAATQLDRWRAALDDVAAHVPEDAESHRFVADVTVRRNGSKPYVVHLASIERLGPPRFGGDNGRR